MKSFGKNEFSTSSHLQILYHQTSDRKDNLLPSCCQEPFFSFLIFSSVVIITNVTVRCDLTPINKHKTAIIVKNGCYEFNYLPFGLKSEPATFMSCFVLILL